MKPNTVGILSVAAASLTALLSLFISAFTGGKSFLLTSFLCAAAACVPFFVTFENKKTSTAFLMLTAVMTAISVGGRILFAPVPFFKPVSAVVILAALCLGANAGFAVGAMSALISNFYFTQGAWTPFQMLAWGLIGFFAGILSRRLEKNKLLLCAYGAVSGLFFSVAMDLWSALFMDGSFNFARFSALFAASLPVTACYCVSNVLFILIIGKPICDSLNRVIKKYNIT